MAEEGSEVGLVLIPFTPLDKISPHIAPNYTKQLPFILVNVRATILQSKTHLIVSTMKLFIFSARIAISTTLL